MFLLWNYYTDTDANGMPISQLFLKSNNTIINSTIFYIQEIKMCELTGNVRSI